MMARKRIRLVHSVIAAGVGVFLATTAGLTQSEAQPPQKPCPTGHTDLPQGTTTCVCVLVGTEPSGAKVLSVLEVHYPPRIGPRRPRS